MSILRIVIATCDYSYAGKLSFLMKMRVLESSKVLLSFPAVFKSIGTSAHFLKGSSFMDLGSIAHEFCACAN